MWPYIRYAVMFLMGLTITVIGRQFMELREELLVLEALSVVALVASLLVPFAAFSENEKWNKQILIHVPYSMFGIYGGLLENPMVWCTLALIASMHMAYWTSGLHSRRFRLQLFLGLSDIPPDIRNQVQRLAGQGKSDEADIIVQQYLKRPT